MMEADEKNAFQFISVLDENNAAWIASIEQRIQELDAQNEKIISIISRSRDTNSAGMERYTYIQQSNEFTREIVGDLVVFTNKRYIKVDETSKLVAASEAEARATLLMIFLIGYFLAGLIVYYFYVLVILPLERFVRALEKGSMEGIAWTSLETHRQDEVGIVYRALEQCLRLPHNHSAKGK